MIYGIDHRIPCTDHLGNEYASIKEMCKRYNIHPEAFSRRIKVYGWSLAKALTTPVKPNGGTKCTDHTGKRFKSVTKMCKYHHIERKTFEYRISCGWSLEDALTTPTDRKENRSS